jgi:hypothetical protein
LRGSFLACGGRCRRTIRGGAGGGSGGGRSIGRLGRPLGIAMLSHRDCGCHHHHFHQVRAVHEQLQSSG